MRFQKWCYQRFIEWVPGTLVPMCAYLRSCFGKCSGISFMDLPASKFVTTAALLSTKCLKTYARGKTSVDWFFGFKLHLVVNDRGELLNIILTPGNTDDRTPPSCYSSCLARSLLTKAMSPKVSQTPAQNRRHSTDTKLKRNMKQRLMPLNDRLLLRKRSIIETIIDQLKNISD